MKGARAYSSAKALATYVKRRQQMDGLVFESVLIIGVALMFVVWGVWQLRRWDRRTWHEPTEPPTER